jgi:hypothetical protein
MLNGQLEAKVRSFRTSRAELSVHCGKELATLLRSLRISFVYEGVL